MMMERIKERNMTTFALSSLLNFGIGLALGLIVGIIATIATRGADAFATMLLVPIVCGVYVACLTRNMYRLYFYYRLSLDVNAVCEGDGKETESYAIAFVLDLVTFGLYQHYWVYKLGQRLHANAPRYGFKMVESGRDIVVLNIFCFGYIAANELIKNMNKIAKVYNRDGLAEVVGGVQ